MVSNIVPMSESDILLNTGYFILRPEIFDYLHEGEELVEEPFYRLIKEQRLMTYENKGFWQSMDTFKDKKLLDNMQARGNPPWEIWNQEVPIYNS